MKLKLLNKLVSLQTTHNHPRQIAAALRLLRHEFKRDFFVRRTRALGKPILLLTNHHGRNFDFIFCGHIDVVAGQEQDFVLKIEGDKLYGRGSRDMKGPLLAGIYAIRYWLKNSNHKLKIAIIISSDEECGGASLEAFLSKAKYRAKFALLPDGGDENEIIIRQKGFLQIKVTAQGQSAHASTAHDGDNPIEKIFGLCQHLRRVWPQPRQRADWRTSIVLTKIQSGDCLNQVPDGAEAWLDIRYIKDEHRMRIIKEVKGYLGKGHKCEVVAENKAFMIQSNNPYLHKLSAAIKKITGRKAKLAHEAGTSDAVFFTENGIPAALFWPSGGRVHQNREWVSQKSLDRFYKIILTFLDSF